MNRDFALKQFNDISDRLGEICELESMIKRDREAGNRPARNDEDSLKRVSAHVARTSPTIGRRYLQATGTKAEGVLNAWRTGVITRAEKPWDDLPNELKPFFMVTWDTTEIDLALLPDYSIDLSFIFRLKTPYISRDDIDFYIIDNPVRSDKVFRLPYVPASGWKGSLRASMVQNLIDDSENLDPEVFAAQRFHLTLIFGDEKGEGSAVGQAWADTEGPPNSDLAGYLDNCGKRAAQIYRARVTSYFGTETGQLLASHSGRLRFYPSFFKQVGLEMINPHTRRDGVGSVPIYLECVPARSDSRFRLLYVPVDRIGKDEIETASQVRIHLALIANGLRRMFCLDGIGAKTSSGFGAIDNEASGLVRIRTLRIKGEDPITANSEPKIVGLFPFLAAHDRLKPDYLNHDGTFKERPEEVLKIMNKKNRDAYLAAKQWWDSRHQIGPSIEGSESVNPTSVPGPPAPIRWPNWTFKSFEELISKADELMKKLTGGPHEL